MSDYPRRPVPPWAVRRPDAPQGPRRPVEAQRRPLPPQIQPMRPAQTPPGAVRPAPAEAAPYIDLDRLLFRFWVNTDRRQELQPESPGSWTPAFDVPTNEPVLGEIPSAGDEREWWLAIPLSLPPFDTPDFFSIPIDGQGTICIPTYATPVAVARYTAPSDRMAMIDGISYEVAAGALNPGDQLEISVRRGDELLARWRDYYVPTGSGDLSSRWVWASHRVPFPIYGRIDRDQTITVTVSVLGAYPFTKTPSDIFAQCVTVILHGWLAPLPDGRDGAPRPADVGDATDMPSDDEAIDALARWISELCPGIGGAPVAPAGGVPDAFAQHDQAAATRTAQAESDRRDADWLKLAAGLVAAGLITGGAQ